MIILYGFVRFIPYTPVMDNTNKFAVCKPIPAINQLILRLVPILNNFQSLKG